MLRLVDGFRIQATKRLGVTPQRPGQLRSLMKHRGVQLVIGPVNNDGGSSYYRLAIASGIEGQPGKLLREHHLRGISPPPRFFSLQELLVIPGVDHALCILNQIPSSAIDRSLKLGSLTEIAPHLPRVLGWSRILWWVILDVFSQVVSIVGICVFGCFL